MYMVRIVWKCARGKVPECLEVVKEVRASWASDGNITGQNLRGLYRPNGYHRI